MRRRLILLWQVASGYQNLNGTSVGQCVVSSGPNSYMKHFVQEQQELVSQFVLWSFWLVLFPHGTSRSPLSYLGIQGSFRIWGHTARILCVHVFSWSHLELENRNFSALATVCLCVCILIDSCGGSCSEHGKRQCITRSETWATANPKRLGNEAHSCGFPFPSFTVSKLCSWVSGYQMGKPSLPLPRAHPKLEV